MATSQRSTVVGVFEDRAQAERAISDLARAGFGDDKVGFVERGGEAAKQGTHPGTRETMDLGAETGTQAGGEFSGALAGTTAGGLLGAAAALLIPGIGPVAATGILGATLAGAGAGAAAGGVLGALVRMDVPEEEARYYEQELRAGRVLVTVKADGRNPEAMAILRGAGGYDVESRPGGRQ